MLPKSQIKLITSLTQKKYRNEHRLFIAEGLKTVTELLDSHIQLHHLYISNPKHSLLNKNHTLISAKDLKRISALKTPPDILGVFKMTEPKTINTKGLIVALDDIRDPGNLGTIIRLCDWFGVKDLVCSRNTVDCYNAKVVQATMGSLSRVNISYLDLENFLEENKNIPIFGTFMNGENIYQKALPESGIIVMGNEANGIQDSISKFTNSRLAIPRFGDLKATESLNVATATAIILSEFRRSFTEM